MTVEPLGPRARRFEYLDLLRLLCAGAVVIFHYGAVAPYTGVISSDFYFMPAISVYGQFGVHVFFMISGFVITLSARGRATGAFLWARFLRLYPAYWICCTITALALWFAGPIHATLWSPNLAQYFVNLTMFQTFLGVPDVDHVYWSLAAELRFYALVTLCLLLRVRIDALWVLAVWLLACWIAPYMPAILGKAAMVVYAPYFIVGILIQRLAEPRHMAIKLALILAALLLAARYIFQQHEIHVARDFNPYTPIVAVAVVWAGALLIAGCVFAPQPSLRTTRILMTIGATTYPLYLLHSGLGFALLARLQGRAPAAIVAIGVTVLITAAVLLISEKLEPALRTCLRAFGKQGSTRNRRVEHGASEA